MVRLMDYLERQPRWRVAALSVLLAIATGVANYLLGSEIASSVFYVPPIALAAWFLGRRGGLAVATFCALARYVADVTVDHYNEPRLAFWNVVTRFGFFIVLALTVSAQRASRDKERALRQFLVHDLRAPLANIQTGLQTLLLLHQPPAGTDGSDPEPPLMRGMLSSSQRLLTLINALLDTDRLEESRAQLHVEELDAAELVRDAWEQVAFWARSLDVQLAGPDGNARVQANRALSVRVLVNLLSNAIKYGPRGGTVRVTFAPGEAGRLAFSVHDDGPGIPPEWNERVFEKFAQVEGSRGARGSGLGLTFCRAAVEAQGGRIWIERDGRPGTTVTFTLPGAMAKKA